MLKLITFGGTGHYNQATYQWGQHSSTTEFIAAALTEWFQPDVVHVMLTPTAESHPNWAALRAAVPQAQPMRIPEPAREESLWDVFRALSQAITPEDEIILDVTHAFRILPLLALASASYMQALTGARIRHILYGAWEARQPPDVCPVFDLKLFLDLQEWTLAASSLRTTGDSRLFAQLLNRIQNDWRAAAAARPHGEALPSRLKSVGASLESLSQALALARPDEVAEKLPKVFRNLQQANDQFEIWAAPFSQALGVIHELYGGLEGGTLASERALVRWYADRDHPIQAVTLAREWIVSCTAGFLGLGRLRGHDPRGPVESLLNHAVMRRNEAIKGTPSPLLPAFDALPAAAALESTWEKARALRNNLAHCGMTPNPLPAATARTSIKELVNQLMAMPLPPAAGPDQEHSAAPQA